MDINKLTVIGRLATKEQQRHGVKLSVVTSYQWADEDSRKRTLTETVAVYARGKLANICTQYLDVGSRLYCEAHMEHRRYIADEIIMLGRKSN